MARTATRSTPQRTVPYVRRIKHWRDRYMVGAPLRWNAPLLFMGERIKPGDFVTEAQRKSVSAARMKSMWNLSLVVNAVRGFARHSDAVDAAPASRPESIAASG